MDRIRTERELIETAYLTLLQLPHGMARVSLQPVLAGLRDQIAAMTGQLEEDVQNQFEALSRHSPSGKETK